VVRGFGLDVFRRRHRGVDREIGVNSTSRSIDTADIVHHAPSGEDWIVAYVSGDTLCPCGWPETLAKLADCTLVRKARPEQRRQLLQRMADIRGNDSRSRHARHVLKQEAEACRFVDACPDGCRGVCETTIGGANV
jgi:hypothetical protein